MGSSPPALILMIRIKDTEQFRWHLSQKRNVNGERESLRVLEESWNPFQSCFSILCIGEIPQWWMQEAIIPYVGKSINMHSLGTILTKLFIVNSLSIAISEWHSSMYYSYIQHCISFCTVNALFIWTAVGNDALQLRCFMIADGSFCCLSKSRSAEENIGPWGPVRDGSEWRRTYEICNRTPQKKWVMYAKLFLVLNV